MLWDLNFICDRCPARTVAIAIKDEMILELCNHHLKKNELQLMAEGWMVATSAVGGF